MNTKVSSRPEFALVTERTSWASSPPPDAFAYAPPSDWAYARIVRPIDIELIEERDDGCSFRKFTLESHCVVLLMASAGPATYFLLRDKNEQLYWHKQQHLGDGKMSISLVKSIRDEPRDNCRFAASLNQVLFLGQSAEELLEESYNRIRAEFEFLDDD